jgi:hypothetical protein
MKLLKGAGRERSLKNIINKSHGLKRLSLSKLVSRLVMDAEQSSFLFRASNFDTSFVTDNRNFHNETGFLT